MLKIKVVDDSGVETEKEVYSVIESQEEHNKIVQSAKSVGKNEILKALEASSVEEVRSKMVKAGEVDTLKKEVEVLKDANKKEAQHRQARDLGIKTSMIDDVLILANASMKEGSDFGEVLKQKATDINAFEIKGNAEKQKEEGPRVVGSPKTKEEKELEAEEAKEMEYLRSL